ncbi:CoB--CoM heterodisulfide reductase iron-sulfur subunit A family protein [bacterium]|nr:CoB--CoM heterodisulfide reductase iron-sulfur subunit A family protein [bacterium]
MNNTYDTLVIGSGIAGMEASLLLAKGGKKVCLVEKLPLIGGNIIKNEESYPHLECSTCMVAPVQQEILQHPNIDLMMLSTVQKVEGEAGDFHVTLHQKPRYVSLTACIGCGMCYEPCPVSLKNEWEENLSDKKAIYIACAGALPNVPVIDPEHCLQISGKKNCKACQEACMFEAIDFSDQENEVDIRVKTIVVATGFELLDVSHFSHLGYGKLPGVYTAMEFERLFASNGPTSGELTLRDGEKAPKSVAIVHCIGRKEQGYCSGVCCMSSLKHAHFVKHKLPDASITHFYSDLCVPGKLSQKFLHQVKEEGVHFIFQTDPEAVRVAENGSGLEVKYTHGKGVQETLSVDMVILEPAMIPDKTASQIAKILAIDQDNHGFFRTLDEKAGSTETSRSGIFVAGCAEGPKDAQYAVIQAESAVGHVVRSLSVSHTE